MNPKILIVDDENIVLEEISRFLRMRGFQTITASSAWEALFKFLLVKPHLVLLDIHMPQVDGIECLRQIKKLNKDAIVIMVTCVTDIDTAKKALELGAKDYILKPFDFEHLETAILAYLFLKSEK